MREEKNQIHVSFVSCSLFYHEQEIGFLQPCRVSRFQVGVQWSNLFKVANPNSWCTLFQLKQVHKHVSIHIVCTSGTKKTSKFSRVWCRGNYRSTLQPENDRPGLGGIINSLWTSVEPPEHVRFCVIAQPKHPQMQRNRVRQWKRGLIHRFWIIFLGEAYWVWLRHNPTPLIHPLFSLQLCPSTHTQATAGTTESRRDSPSSFWKSPENPTERSLHDIERTRKAKQATLYTEAHTIKSELELAFFLLCSAKDINKKR